MNVKRRAMYDSGATDMEIAGATGVPVRTVRAWREYWRLPPNPDREYIKEARLSAPDSAVLPELCRWYARKRGECMRVVQQARLRHE